MIGSEREEALRLAAQAGLLPTGFMPASEQDTKDIDGLAFLIRLARQSAPQQEPWSILEAERIADEYIVDWMYPVGDGNGRTPTDKEREACHNAITGLLANLEFIEAMRASPPVNPDVQAEIERLRAVVQEYRDDFDLATFRTRIRERWGIELDEISEALHEADELRAKLEAKPDVVREALLREARSKIILPPRLIRVPNGEPFTPMGSIEVQIGGPPEDAVAGGFAGYQTVNSSLVGNWSSGIGSWRVSSMVWAENPDYAEAIAYRDRIDAALQSQGIDDLPRERPAPRGSRET